MSIIRHEIRQISDENRDQPIISQAVVHGNVAYFAGITPNPIVGDIKAQTAQVLRRVDELLNLAGTDKSKLLSAQVWIADMRLFEDHNSVWNEWVDPANPPVRACLPFTYLLNYVLRPCLKINTCCPLCVKSGHCAIHSITSSARATSVGATGSIADTALVLAFS